jgi:hypothetical protein
MNSNHMEKPQDLVARACDALLQVSNDAEDALKEQDVEAAHQWMFNVREVLYDFRRVNLLLASLSDAKDGEEAATILGKFAETLLYEVLPHVQGHMTELEEQLKAFGH